MELLLNEIERLSKIDLNQILVAIFQQKDIQDFILNLIKQDQLRDKGVSEENILLGVYSPYTEQINPEKQAGTHYTLFDTGAFYDSMFISVLADSIIINGDGQKVDSHGVVTDLFVKFNDKGNILGLTPENMEKLIDEIYPLIYGSFERLL